MKGINLLVALFIVVTIAGCASFTTYKYDKEGKVIEKTEGERPILFNKSVSIGAKAIGLELTMFDPNTGAYSPCVKVLYGKGDTDTMPMLDGNGDVADTYSEDLTIESSWWGAEVSSIEYSRRASGKLKEITPAVDVKMVIDKTQSSSLKSSTATEATATSTATSKVTK